MATNHTENYNLNLWEPNDKFVREEFNENTTKLDAAIKAEADARAALAQTVNTKADQTALTAETNARTAAVNAINTTLSGMVKLAAGSYTGDGSAYRTINVGFTPKAVLLLDEYGAIGSHDSYTVGGLAVSGSSVKYTYDGKQTSFEIVSGGFRVRQYDNNYRAVLNNATSMTYHYLAIG